MEWPVHPCGISLPHHIPDRLAEPHASRLRLDAHGLTGHRADFVAATVLGPEGFGRLRVGFRECDRCHSSSSFLSIYQHLNRTLLQLPQCSAILRRMKATARTLPLWPSGLLSSRLM